LTIAQAAKILGLSTRTIRRSIKAGKIKAELVPGTFGEEYRITELPADPGKEKDTDYTPRHDAAQPSTQDPVQTSVHTLVQAPGQVMDIIRELQDKNLALAAQLGAATERIRNLENKVRLLTTTKIPWWKRLFSSSARTG